MRNSKRRILVTGAAGFIGGSVMSRLTAIYSDVQGIDNFSDYYDVRLKRHHIDTLGIKEKVLNLDICNLDALEKLLSLIHI